MRWLVILFLWVAAIVVAVLILRRMRRGKPVVLTGRWSPRLVRMIAVVLVVLGLGEEATTPQAVGAPVKVPVRPADDELPKTINALVIQNWLFEHQENGQYGPGKRGLTRALAGHKLVEDHVAVVNTYVRRLPEALRKLVQADRAAIADGRTDAAATDVDLVAALDGLEKAGWYDHFWNAYLWRKARGEAKDPAKRIALYARLRQHARITDALIRAHAQVKPLMQPPRAWMSKAGVRKEDRPAVLLYEKLLADMVKVANQTLPTTDEGTWKRDGIALIKPVKDAAAPVLVRAGKERVLPADEPTRFGRLDLLKTSDKPATINHDWLGKLDLPANRLVSVWELANYLPDDAKKKLDETVHDALKNNSEDAADRLERCLALSHQAIRIGLKELPTAKGAPRLRLILALFDDTVMPALPAYRAGESLERHGGARTGR
jgi:hypothetical protein